MVTRTTIVLAPLIIVILKVMRKIDNRNDKNHSETSTHSDNSTRATVRAQLVRTVVAKYCKPLSQIKLSGVRS